MIYCDVCESILVINGSADLEEEFKVICPECGYDNTYQLENNLSDQVGDFIDANEIYDDEILISVLAERFGTDPNQLREMIDEKEMLGWDMRVRKK